MPRFLQVRPARAAPVQLSFLQNRRRNLERRGPRHLSKVRTIRLRILRARVRRVVQRRRTVPGGCAGREKNQGGSPEARKGGRRPGAGRENHPDGQGRPRLQAPGKNEKKIASDSRRYTQIKLHVKAHPASCSCY